MPFGKNNAPSTFQRVVDVILATVKWKFSLVYLYDVLVFSSSFEEYFEHVATVLRVLKDARFAHKVNNCAFLTDAVDYFGHFIKPGKLEIATRTKSAIVGSRLPRKVTESRSFLWLCTVFRRSVPNFAIFTAPLNRKPLKGEPTIFEHLTENEGKDFLSLKSKLIEPPVLALRRGIGKYTVDTDACNEQFGFVQLLKKPDGVKQLIGYW